MTRRGQCPQGTTARQSLGPDAPLRALAPPAQTNSLPRLSNLAVQTVQAVDTKPGFSEESMSVELHVDDKGNTRADQLVLSVDFMQLFLASVYALDLKLASSWI